MKKINSLSFFSMTCLSIIFLGMFSVATRGFTRVLVKKNICPTSLSKIVFFDREDLRSNASEQEQIEIQDELVSVNWKELYPFENENIKSDNFQVQQKIEIKMNFAFVEKIKYKINFWCNEAFFLRNFWINSSKRIVYFLVGDINMIKRVDGIITLGKNGEYFSYVSGKLDVSQQAKAVIELNGFLKQNGIPFLYVQAPFKISSLDDEAGTSDFSNQNADDFLKLLKEGGVDFIDMREEILKTGKDFHDFFYKTDHHWKSETGLFACPIIAEKLNEIAGTEIDTKFFNPHNFDFEIFKDSFLGSQGRTLTLAKAKMEDITLITPKKDFDLQTEIYSSNARIRKASGGFETFIFKKHIQSKETALTDSAYSMYMNGDTNEFIKNVSNQNDSKILFCGDSFSDVVEPFFALAVKNFDSLDLRCFDGSFKSYIKQNKPYDGCVLICNPSAFGNSRLWNFE